MVFTPKILIIDDEPGMCESLRDFFDQKGYEVTTAGSGKEAREILQDRRFDLALLDMVIPDMDGHQLIDLINEKNPSDTNEWLAVAEGHEGSWWVDWFEWLAPKGGKKQAARVPGDGKLKPIEDAPGSYVKHRSPD